MIKGRTQSGALTRKRSKSTLQGEQRGSGGGVDDLMTCCCLLCRTLGNLADSEFLRERIGERGAIPPLVKILASSSNDETMGAAAYCLWNLSLSSTKNQEVIRGVPGVFNLLLRLSATVRESNEYLLNAVENVLWCIGGLLDEVGVSE